MASGSKQSSSLPPPLDESVPRWIHHRHQKRLYALAAVGLAVSALAGAVLCAAVLSFEKPDVYRPWTLPTGSDLCDCGPGSADEARRRGCAYDALAAAWLPERCRDDELTAEFRRAGPGPEGEWAYFGDAEGRQALSEAQVAAMGGQPDDSGSAVFWSTREWHVAHCVYYWQKYARMRHTGAVMERRFDGIAHARHCGRLVARRAPEGGGLIRVTVRTRSGGG